MFRSILGPLSRRLDVTHFCPNLVTRPVEDRYCVLPRLLPGDVFGRESLPALLAKLDPDYLLLCHDPPFWNVHKRVILAHKARRGGRPFCAFYCPVEWEDLNPELIRGTTGLDALVLYSEFGRRVVDNAFRSEPERMPPVCTIPHGVDTAVFHPLHGGCRREARRRLFPDRPQLHDAFLVLNANRNCLRKRIERTLEGFAAFASGHPDAYLYLHMGTTDSGCDVLGLASRLGIADRVVLSHREPHHPAVSDDRLNLIYNACDVGINTSTGEGWGLVTFEHAATGALQIVPDHSACREHWSGRAILLRDRGGDIAADEVARALDQARREPEAAAALARAGSAYAREPRFSWEAIAMQWLALFERPAVHNNQPRGYHELSGTGF